jgi:vancomycin permeability regulator SanA
MYRYMIQFFSLHMLIVLILSIGSCGSVEKAFEKARPQMPFDVVVVPGVPFDTAWSDVMRARVLWSYHLYNQGLTKNVIYSGSAVYTPYIEARIMALYAIELGIPAEHVFTEEKAEHSTENIFYSYYLAKDLGFERVALTTDPFQNAMLISFVKSKKLDVTHVPANFDTIKTHYSDIRVHIDPSWAKADSFVSLPERESFWKRLRGTMGKNLKYAPHEISDSNMRYETVWTPVQ